MEAAFHQRFDKHINELMSSTKIISVFTQATKYLISEIDFV